MGAAYVSAYTGGLIPADDISGAVGGIVGLDKPD
jgi:hypothetical protein